jgi:hypothetical protein
VVSPRLVTRHIARYDNFVVTADIDGNFDLRGLPDLFVLAFSSCDNDLVIQLIVVRNCRDN